MAGRKFNIDPATIAAISAAAKAIPKTALQSANRFRPIFEACAPLLENTKELEPLLRDSVRAKRIAEVLLASKQETFRTALDSIQKEIDSGPPLNARQVFFLIMETKEFSVDDGLKLLIEIGRSVQAGGRKGHVRTYGTEDEKNAARSKFQKMVDMVARKYPKWSFEAIKKQTVKENSGEVSIHQLKRYTKDPRKN